MSFDFKGTFNASQHGRFAAFARSQLGLVADRISHLESELNRIGTLQFGYDSDGVPTGYSVARPPDSYISKLVAVYEALGGDPFFDLKIRSQSQPVFVVKGDEADAPTRMSSGEIISMPGQNDAPTAELMHQAREWMKETLRYRRDHIERKIRRAIDYSDQLQTEIAALQSITKGAEVSGSLENIFKEVGDYINDRTYRAIYDDKGKDPHGLKVNAPFGAYEPGPDQTTNPDQRGLEGFESATDDTETA